MATDRDGHAGALALLGGGALLLWLVLRGSGSGSAVGGDSSRVPALARLGPPPPPVRVWIRGDRIDADGVTTDLPTLISRARAVGRADVSATGDAITGTIATVVRSLQAAGVVVFANPDVWTALGSADLRTA